MGIEVLLVGGQHLCRLTNEGPSLLNLGAGLDPGSILVDPERQREYRVVSVGQDKIYVKESSDVLSPGDTVGILYEKDARIVK